MIGPAQRPLGIVDAEPHGDIDFLSSRDPFFEASRRFVDNQAQYTRKRQAGGVLDPDRLLTERLEKLLGLHDRVFGRSQTAGQFNQLSLLERKKRGEADDPFRLLYP